MTAISKKVCMLGEFAVGKTSLVRRFVFERFDDRYISTIGVKVSRKTVVMTQRQATVQLTMMLWDLAGSEEFNQLRTSYLRGYNWHYPSLRSHPPGNADPAPRLCGNPPLNRSGYALSACGQQGGFT